jgi:uncharacterized protein
MILDLKGILEDTEVNEVLERDWWHPGENDPILGIGTPLHVSIKITRVGDKFLLDGKLTGGIMVRCDRCLDAFHRDVESGFHVFLAYPGQGKDRAEVELLDEDMERPLTSTKSSKDRSISPSPSNRSARRDVWACALSVELT